MLATLNAFIRLSPRLTATTLVCFLTCAGSAVGSALADAPARLVPILFAGAQEDQGMLLGAWSGGPQGRWLDWKQTHGLLKGGETYRLMGRDSIIQTRTGKKPILSQASGAAYYIGFRGTLRGEGPFMGLGGAWNPRPRPVKTGSAANAQYVAAVASALKSKGMGSAAPRIVRVAQADLEGRGTLSTLIEAASPGLKEQRATGDNLKPGMYSFVLLLRGTGPQAQAHILGGAFARPVGKMPDKKREEMLAEQYELVSVLDLNGDGVMEIVVASSYYEGGGASVYSMRNGQAVSVLTASDGL